MTIRLSILDQSIAIKGRPHAAAIQDTLALAEHAERLGYHRFWVSEHHNHATIVGTAPEVLMAAIAARTETIRIGSAGVMLPHYSALKVAEQFRVLEAPAPGRINLGGGRAPGSVLTCAQRSCCAVMRISRPTIFRCRCVSCRRGFRASICRWATLAAG